MHMNEKVKSVLVCIISLLAILGVIFVMSSNIDQSIKENSSISR